MALRPKTLKEEYMSKTKNAAALTASLMASVAGIVTLTGDVTKTENGFTIKSKKPRTSKYITSHYAYGTVLGAIIADETDGGAIVVRQSAIDLFETRDSWDGVDTAASTIENGYLCFADDEAEQVMILIDPSITIETEGEPEDGEKGEKKAKKDKGDKAAKSDKAEKAPKADKAEKPKGGKKAEKTEEAAPAEAAPKKGGKKTAEKAAEPAADKKAPKADKAEKADGKKKGSWDKK